MAMIGEKNLLIRKSSRSEHEKKTSESFTRKPNVDYGEQGKELRSKLFLSCS